MSDSISTEKLLARWRAGDQHAAQQLFELYASRLAALAERHISNCLSRRLDPEDIVQSVFRTFFKRSAEGEFQINRESELWHLLVKITVCKARTQARKHTWAKRDVSRETRGDSDAWLIEAAGREPGPSEAAELVDQVAALLEGLPPEHAEVLALSLEGYSRTEIAQRLGHSRQTVYRILALLQQRLRRVLDATP